MIQFCQGGSSGLQKMPALLTYLSTVRSRGKSSLSPAGVRLRWSEQKQLPATTHRQAHALPGQLGMELGIAAELGLISTQGTASWAL